MTSFHKSHPLSFHSQFEQQLDRFSIRTLNVENPHGFLGVLCSEINDTADRSLDIAYPLYALQILLLTTIKNSRKGINGEKISLITMLIALSGSGKNAPQTFLKKIARVLGLSQYIFDKPRSDKDLIHNLVDNKGVSCYLVDEAHDLLESMTSAYSSTYLKGIETEILKLATASLYELSGNHRREFGQKYSALISGLKGKLEAGDSASDIQRLDELEATLDKIINGFENPILNAALASTPEKFDSFISLSNIEKGLLGRCIILRAPDSRSPLKTPVTKEPSESTIDKLKEISGQVANVIISDEAEVFLKEIRDFYDQDEYRNHQTLGAIYARVYERVIGISNILGLVHGEATIDDIRYALLLTLQHIHDLNSLLKKGKLSIEDELIARIYEEIPEVGKSQSVVKQHAARPKKFHVSVNTQDDTIDLFDHCLNKLIAGKSLRLDGGRLYKCNVANLVESV